MFRLHDKSRRRTCRTAFLTVAVLPTASVLVWAAAEHFPGRVTRFERELRQYLRLAVSLHDVSNPRPGHILMTGLRIIDPESGDVVLSCPAMETAHRDGRLVIVAAPVEVSVRRFQLLADVVRRRMRDVADGDDADLRFVANAVTFSAPNGPQTFTGIVGDVEHDEKAVCAHLQFRLAGDSTSDLGRLQIQLSSDSKSGNARVAVELHTGGAPIPLAPLETLWPAIRHLGGTASFRGSVWAHEEAGGWRGEVSGQLGEVDLTRLVSDQFPQKLSGIARVTIDKAQFQESRLISAMLRIESDGGQIEDSLLTAAQAHLGMRLRKSPPPTDRFCPYSKLQVWTELGAGELTIRAANSPENSSAVLTDSAGPLLFEPASKQPIIHLVRTLVPSRETLVPASAETEALLPRLPLPTARSSNGPKTAPRSYLRLDESK